MNKDQQTPVKETLRLPPSFRRAILRDIHKVTNVEALDPEEWAWRKRRLEREGR